MAEGTGWNRIAASVGCFVVFSRIWLNRTDFGRNCLSFEGVGVFTTSGVPEVGGVFGVVDGELDSRFADGETSKSELLVGRSREVVLVLVCGPFGDCAR